MSHLDQTIDAVLWFLVLMIPVVAVILLLFAAHVIGGALKAVRRNTESRTSAPVAEQPSETTERTDATKPNAA